MNPLESQLSYEALEMPQAGELGQVMPGIGWVRMPLPFALDHINLWVLDDPQPQGPGWTQVDCGIASKVIQGLWQQIFDGPLAQHRLVRVLVTHMHPDHVGLSGMLCDKDGADLWMTLGDYALARLLSGGGSPDAQAGRYSTITHFRQHGVTDAALIESLAQRRDYFPTLVPNMPGAVRRIRDAELIQIGAHSWRVIVGEGHSPEHASLYCEELGVLISGDMVLPRISTNVSVFATEPEANPLQLYLDSVQRLLALPEDTLVLPSHGRPFRGLHTRIAQQLTHHEERLAEVQQACEQQACHALEIVKVLFQREFDTHQLTFALGESIAHLHMLWQQGKLERFWAEDDCWRFRAC